MERDRLRSARESSRAYHHIHKHLVGPKTADRLMQHFVELTQTQDVKEMYEAGWAAVEAAIVAKGRPKEDRLEMLRAGGEAWEYARQLAYERAQRKETPQFDRVLRIETTQSAYPALEAIVRGKLDVNARKEYFSRLLDVTHRTGEFGLDAKRQNLPSYGAYFGLKNEQNAILGINRLMTSHLLAVTSLARSDDGNYYPNDAHDVQVFSFFKQKSNRKRRLGITPMEVKSRVRPIHYAHPVISAKHDMHVETIEDAVAYSQLVEREFNHETLDEDQLFWLSDVTTDFVNMISIYQKDVDVAELMQDFTLEIESLDHLKAV